MYKSILVPIALDHDHATADALAIARALLADGGKITALHVSEDVPAYVLQYLPDGQLGSLRADAAKDLSKDVAGYDDVETDIVTGHPGRAIIDYADQKGIDLVVIASHRPGLQDYLLGSTAARVVRHVSCAVHVLR